jgi:anti-anti-sigma factor
MTATVIEQIDGVPIARVRQDIDAATVASIQALLEDAVGPDSVGLVIDLADTRYVDSAGIDMLLRLRERLTQRRAQLILVVPPASQLKRLIGLVGLDRAIALHATVEDAQRAAARRRGGPSLRPPTT